MLNNLYQDWYTITRAANVKEQEENPDKVDTSDEEEAEDSVEIDTGLTGDDLVKA